MVGLSIISFIHSFSERKRWFDVFFHSLFFFFFLMVLLIIFFFAWCVTAIKSNEPFLPQFIWLWAAFVCREGDWRRLSSWKILPAARWSRELFVYIGLGWLVLIAVSSSAWQPKGSASNQCVRSILPEWFLLLIAELSRLLSDIFCHLYIPLKWKILRGWLYAVYTESDTFLELKNIQTTWNISFFFF